MESVRLEKQLFAEPIDEKTRAALDKARASLARGEGMTLEESDLEIEKGYEEWLESQKVPRAA
jgi:hypothetical protein